MAKIGRREVDNTDHDLLVTVHEQVKQVRVDIQELKDGTATRLTLLEKDHVSLEDKKDHEDRIRRLELWGAIAIGLTYALQFYFNFLRK